MQTSEGGGMGYAASALTAIGGTGWPSPAHAGPFDPDVIEPADPERRASWRSEVPEAVDPDVAVEPNSAADPSSASDPTVSGDPNSAADPSMVEDLGDEIATLAAHIHAATHRFLALIGRFDRLDGWEPAGHRSCAHWLAFRTGLDLGTAREHVRVARALEGLPRTSATMAQGRLSFSQVRALTRVADAATEDDLLELAEGCTTAQLERMVRAWKKGSREDEAAWERERHRSRTLSVFPDDDGMYVVKGRLDPEVGALLMRAVEAASDALYRSRRPIPDRLSGEARVAAADHAEAEAARRRADAVGLLAERALAAGFGSADLGSADGESDAGETEPVDAGESTDASESTDTITATEPTDMICAAKTACACGGANGTAPISGTRAARYQVVLHVEHATLTEDGDPGRSQLEDGTRVSAETSRRLSCDASVVRVGQAPRSRLLDVGRRTRTISPALRRALEVRDGGCRFPGCGLRFTDAHHIVHWADGGETSLGNTVLLCRYHHRLVHEDDWRIEWWGSGRAAFRDPRGSVHLATTSRPPPRVLRSPATSLARVNRLRGADPDAWTASARWKREADIPDEVLFRATEAAL